MTRAKLIPPRAASEPVYTCTEEDKALIARALREASLHHTDPYNLTFVGDADTGRAMAALLLRLFANHAQAFAEADALRDALAAGYMPPPGSDMQSVARGLLAKRAHVDGEAKRKAKRATVPSRACNDWHDDLDLPF